MVCFFITAGLAIIDWALYTMYATRAVNNIFPYMEINDVNVYYALTMYGIAGM